MAWQLLFISTINTLLKGQDISLLAIIMCVCKASCRCRSKSYMDCLQKVPNVWAPSPSSQCVSTLYSRQCFLILLCHVWSCKSQKWSREGEFYSISCLSCLRRLQLHLQGSNLLFSSSAVLEPISSMVPSILLPPILVQPGTIPFHCCCQPTVGRLWLFSFGHHFP